MLQIKQISQQTLNTLYAKRFTFDFEHADLLRPFERMVELIAQNKYIACGFYNESALVAYTFFALQDNILFLDFFAVDKNCRGSGIGGSVLDLLKEKYPQYAIVIEVEKVAAAEDESDRILRERRIRFYERNGFKMQNLSVTLLGAPYDIMTLNLNKEPQWIAQILEQIYINLYTEEAYFKKVKILLPSINN